MIEFLLICLLLILFGIFVFLSSQKPIGISSNYSLCLALKPYISRPLYSSVVSHYEGYSVVRKSGFFSVSVVKKGRYGYLTSVHTKVFAVYLKSKFSNLNLSTSELTQWLTSKTAPYNISYGAVRGFSRRALSKLTKIPYETLVANFGEHGEFDTLSFDTWFRTYNLDIAFVSSLAGIPNEYEFAKIDGISYLSSDYKLYTPPLYISTDVKANLKYASNINFALNELCRLYPNNYFHLYS